MKKLLSVSLVAVMCFLCVACSGVKNYPGQYKDKYWVSEDNRIAFWFPDKNEKGKAEACMIIYEALRKTFTLEWEGKDGFVTAENENGVLFRAKTETDSKNLTCTFEFEEKNDFFASLSQDTIVFRYRSDDEVPKYLVYDEPFMPENTTLDLWMVQDVSDFDFSELTFIPGCYGGSIYIGKDYEAIRTEVESGDNAHVEITMPEVRAEYTVSRWPEQISPHDHVTYIYITDPAVKIWGLTVESTVEEFDEILLSRGFVHGERLTYSEEPDDFEQDWIVDNGEEETPFWLVLSNRSCKKTIRFRATVKSNGIQY